ncbi:MAG TPA: 2-oxoacid:acceptor oxidoreductase family protein, partial [Candidatus Nanoarchaeia archaeon]|nr:2-oxoacid:acceptor oxidoreductase family protein [Candidatus Nanoarchaeia archaeon]
MSEEIIFSGFGGQGVVLAANVIAQTAVYEGKNMAAMVSYGAEMRGGTSSSTLIISEKEIYSPVVEHPSVAVVLNQPSLDLYEPLVKKGGLLIVNSSLTDRKAERKDIDVIYIPATDIANTLGNVKIANMILVGALVARKRLVSIENVLSILPKAFPKNKQEFVEIN